MNIPIGTEHDSMAPWNRPSEEPFYLRNAYLSDDMSEVNFDTNQGWYTLEFDEDIFVNNLDEKYGDWVVNNIHFDKHTWHLTVFGSGECGKSFSLKIGYEKYIDQLIKH